MAIGIGTALSIGGGLLSAFGDDSKSTTQSKTEIPKWVEDQMKANLNRGNRTAEIGYTPNYGPQVAAFNPTQMGSFGATGRTGASMGLLAQGATGTEGIPTPTDYGNGMKGYSSGPMYDQMLAELEQRRPGQKRAIDNMFLDPITGKAPDFNPAPGAQPAPPEVNQALNEAMQTQGGTGMDGSTTKSNVSYTMDEVKDALDGKMGAAIAAALTFALTRSPTATTAVYNYLSPEEKAALGYSENTPTSGGYAGSGATSGGGMGSGMNGGGLSGSASFGDDNNSLGGTGY